VGGWHPSALVLGAGLLALFQFGRAFSRLRARGRTDLAGWDRAVLFSAGVAATTLPLVSPLDASLAGHMLEHVLLGDVGPALCVVAVRGPLLFFLLPPAAARAVAHTEPLRRAVSALARPPVAVSTWAAAYAVWHVPAAFELALRSEPVHAAEHVSFGVAGVLVWMQLVGPPGRRVLGVGGRLALAGAVFACGQILSDVLLLSGIAVYPSYAGDGALRDQQLAGLVMMVEQLVTLGACSALLLRSSLRRLPGRAAAAPARA
jgi:cytochrome c oxidase assembly factor CtaG